MQRLLALGYTSTEQQLFSIPGYSQHGHGNVLMQIAIAGCVGLLLTLCQTLPVRGCQLGVHTYGRTPLKCVTTLSTSSSAQALKNSCSVLNCS